MSNLIKSWASSLLFIESEGWYGQVRVTLDYEEQTFRITPMEKEAPYTSWLHSGVLLLSLRERVDSQPAESVFIDQELVLAQSTLILPLTSYQLYYCTPFDFIHKQPVAETRHKLLQ